MLKRSNHQLTNYYTAIAQNPTRTVMANIAPYRLATGTTSLLTNGTRKPAGCASNANYHNCRAVGFNDLLAAPMIPVKAILITFE